MHKPLASFCQAVEKIHSEIKLRYLKASNVGFFNTPDGTPLDRLKNAVLTAWDMTGYPYHRFRLRKQVSLRYCLIFLLIRRSRCFKAFV